MTNPRYIHPHIILSSTSETTRFRPISSGRIFHRLPDVERQQHATKLLRQLGTCEGQLTSLSQNQTAAGITGEHGITLLFESHQGFELKFDSLEVRRYGIELLTVQKKDNKTFACVMVPEGQIKRFISKVEKYRTEETISGKFKNKPLIESISDIRKATLDAFWTDDISLIPAEGQTIWWEIWLRSGSDKSAIVELFRHYASQTGLQVKEEEINFPERTIILAYGTREQISNSLDMLNAIAELRKAKPTPVFFLRMDRREQTHQVEEALQRLHPATNDMIAVCILDTGVTQSHPLIQPHLANSDIHIYDPTWSRNDHIGHGTEMAGLALYGDIASLLSSMEQREIPFKLESVKILPPLENDNNPHLYGKITEECVHRPEVTAPYRKRVFSMAVTAIDFRDQGQPSSWSASIDMLCSGAEEEDKIKRLMVISAGNADSAQFVNYPANNQCDGIHDPAQSWNALCVGACTDKIRIYDPNFQGWQPIAPQGDLCPSSTTSMIWESQWPIKPDVVFEGGNWAKSPTGNYVDPCDDLQLLTTYYQPLQKYFVASGDTSAATAQVAGMAGIIQAEYPQLWPETVRALIVHSARWTAPMVERFAPLNNKQKWENLIRMYGFGIPNVTRAIRSAQNALTLIVQDELSPFELRGKSITMRDMHFHRIPWPTEILGELGDANAEMRVTLSYFIEPNPGHRGWKRRYKYASHGLRFDVKTARETDDEFKRRINKAARDEEDFRVISESDSSEWSLGAKLRTKGSIHSDIWHGSAVDLSQRAYIGVYPVSGWWKERQQLRKWDSKARYSLIVSISTPDNDIDIYTPIVNQIGIRIQT